MQGENIVMEDEDKAETFNGFFASVFTRKASCCQGTKPPALEDDDKEWDEAPLMKWETVLNFHKSMGLNRIHSRVLKEVAEVFAKPFSVIYHQF